MIVNHDILIMLAIKTRMYIKTMWTGFYLENSFWGRNRVCKFILGEARKITGYFLISIMAIFKIFGGKLSDLGGIDKTLVDVIASHDNYSYY